MKTQLEEVKKETRKANYMVYTISKINAIRIGLVKQWNASVKNALLNQG